MHNVWVIHDKCFVCSKTAILYFEYPYSLALFCLILVLKF